jgi:C-terminal processing protease CtpA/Prc
MRRLLLLAALAFPVLAQMTPEQRAFDFQALVASLNRNYAPYEWKRELFGFDMLNLKPWLERIRNAKDDLDYYDITAQYLSSLGDTHTSYRIPSNFVASTGLHADIYDGKIIIDNIVRATLPAARYPFVIGDELLAVDGKPAAELLEFYKRYSYAGNDSSSSRNAAFRLVSRPQSVIPRAHEIGDTVVLLVRHPDGKEEEITVPWIKTGQPLLKAGPVPSPVKSARQAARSKEEAEAPAYMQSLIRLQQDYVETDEAQDVLNYGSLNQVWVWPASAGYVARNSAYYRVGTFQFEGLRIGYLRIPNFSPASTAAALTELDTHVQFFNANTDGLVIDVMRNNGGAACYNEEMQRRFIPYMFRGLGRELRANRIWLNQFSSAYEAAKAANADTWVIESYKVLLDEMQRAVLENRARTGPVPICGPQLERTPAAITYAKPLIVMTDVFSTSAADGFPAALQDANRGPIFGTRTNGAGGTVFDFSTGVYSEATSRSTAGMHHRRNPVVAPGYPTSNYVENVGVQPDIYYDFMTLENLRTGGRPFVDAFSRAIADHIRSAR